MYPRVKQRGDLAGLAQSFLARYLRTDTGMGHFSERMSGRTAELGSPELRGPRRQDLV